MGEADPPESVVPIAGILASSLAFLTAARDALVTELGVIEAASEPYRWTESDYYTAEMGAEIWRQFVAGQRLVDPGDLAAIKRRTNTLEARWRDARGRQVNIDPGYLAVDKVVLASTKDAAHRIYLDDGIYAEATLRYAGGTWQPYAYTYRDYAGESAVAFFTSVRAGLLARRRSRRPAAAVPTTTPPAARPVR